MKHFAEFRGRITKTKIGYFVYTYLFYYLTDFFLCFIALQIFFYKVSFVFSVDDQYETPLKSSKIDLASW